MFRAKSRPADPTVLDAPVAATAVLEEQLRLVTTERDEGAATHQAAIDRYELMLKAAGIGLWHMYVVADDPVNPNNEFIWSAEFRHMLGFRDERDFPNILSSWASRLHPDDAPRTVEAFLAHLTDPTGRAPYDIEYQLMLKDGTYRWFRATGATHRDEAGRPLQVAGALRDVHDAKLLAVTSSDQLAQLSSGSEQLQRVSSDLSQAVAAAVASASEAASTISQLDESSAQIGAVIKLITSIASQTNLLALNATIEAARAGDAGRGFAVVAAEVKELANETARATGDISEQVEAIRLQSGAAVTGIQEIEAAMTALSSTQQAIDDLVNRELSA